MNNAGKDFLSHAVFPHNENREINGCNLKCDVDGPIKTLGVAYNSVALFDSLQ